MNFLKKIWDFMLGVLLIGFGPLIVCFAFMFLLGFFAEQWLPQKTPETRTDIIVVYGSVAFFLSILTFIMAIRFRLRHRLLPKPVIAMEAVLGIIIAFLYFMFFGVVSYSAYGN
jgi:hypothetical protein